MNAPIGPARNQGKISSSSHLKSVRVPLSIGSRVNTPLPVTMPMCLTPIALPGTHWVISILSVRRIGPTFVSHKNAVPTPRVCGETKRIATASCIQSTWRSTGSTICQTFSGVASISIETLIMLIVRRV